MTSLNLVLIGLLTTTFGSVQELTWQSWFVGPNCGLRARSRLTWTFKADGAFALAGK